MLSFVVPAHQLNSQNANSTNGTKTGMLVFAPDYLMYTASSSIIAVPIPGLSIAIFDSETRIFAIWLTTEFK